MKISSREDAIEFRQLRDHVGVMFASKNITKGEGIHLNSILRAMRLTLKENGYEVNTGREDNKTDMDDDLGGWTGHL